MTIEEIIFDLGNYASNEKPQTNEHNVIIPFSLHYIDANLLFDYICELEEENKKLKEEHKELVETNYDLAMKKTKLEEENKKLKSTMKYTYDITV